MALRLSCLIFGSGEDADPPIRTGRAAARVLWRDDPVVRVFGFFVAEALWTLIQVSEPFFLKVICKAALLEL